ncbi:MAG: ABC transporter permease [Euryarchaeota archaeon]|nr:ABC transporter permease [Euryarchaeota archaeon]
MSELSGLAALWLREFKVFTREHSRMVSAVFTPILWLLVFGGGLGSSIAIRGISYQTFIYPGIVCMSLLFTSVFFGVYIVWDRKIDFLKEVLVAPLRRSTIFLGKVIGGMTDALIQTTIILALGPFFGIGYSATALAEVYLVILLLAAGLVSLGLLIGSQMESPEGFGMVVSFVVYPMFFLSGALFPIDGLPPWLSAFVYLDPLTYGVDAMRGALLGQGRFPFVFDLAILAAFALGMAGAGTMAFRRMKV